MKKKLICIAINSAFVGGALALSPGAFAQEQTTPNVTPTADKVEKIQVTGSRLRRDSFNMATPLVTIDKESIQDTGLGSLAEILVEEIPSISEGSSNTNSQSSVSTTGLSTINLRDLGTDRTLTLIDGRRVVSNSYSGNFVSLSTIPSGMVDRVEIISGGASAIYGSDAIAGVVNIITQSSKEGFEFRTRAGQTPEGGGKEFTVDANYGTSFDNDRAYVFFSATWDRQFGLDFVDRDRAQIESSYDYNTSLLCNENNTESGDQCMRDITQADWRERSDGTAGGVFEEGNSAANGGYFFNEAGLQTGWVEERDGLNSEIYDKLKVPIDRLAAAFKFNYDLTDDVSSTFQIQYASNQSINVKSPEDDAENSDVLILDPITGAPGEVRPGSISPDNPFVPAEIAANAGSSVSWDRRFFEVGNIITDNDRETIRSWLGFQGTVFEDDWDWDVSVGYGKFKQRQSRLNELDVVKTSQALDAEFAADGVTIQCADADARSAGCVPLNIFGVGSITPDAADWIRANPRISTDISQINFLGYIAGDLFDMPAGPVATVFGVEYRKDTQKLRTNDEQRFGGVTFNVVPSFDADLEVMEVFAEAAVPLLVDQPFAKSLTAETSLRLAEYSFEGIDTVASYKLGLAWQPADGYLIRANYARAQRAPSITEALSPARGDFDSFDDICAEVTATSTEEGHASCRLDPGIAATIARLGVFEDENNGYSPNAGNESLTEETADTYTFGITMSPTFIENFNIAIDYYDITVKDAIGTIANQDILRNCYESSVAFGSGNSFCNDIRRDDDGQLIEILQREFNLDEIATRGYDIAISYRYDLEQYGSLRFKADMNHVIEHSRSFVGNDGLEIVNNKGQLSTGIFDNRASASVSWRKDNWRVRWSTRFKSSTVDDLDRVEDYQERFAQNQLLIDAGDPDAILNPEIPLYLFYGSYTTHNLSASYNLELDGSELRLFGGANNVFDNQGPFVPNTGDNVESGRGNFESEYGGGLGRFVYLGFELSF
ncbi:TonB-dependent receptor domain-containing protein [Glaciecola sp. 33A]|jgi:iron complex outermembrane receptor protein|uniref:TonB-dependent receptor domain-containing protein n=1 Tax=Glaciecola sp. 33A TaxID=2057807 RepID=UPI000C328BDE|nr:TonB-dependent receptor [Glaciecola sp. 33A]PKI02031.1 TonB-dependent receptor [Glaciecola sp. 33A]